MTRGASSLLSRVEALATAVYGPTASVSVDAGRYTLGSDGKVQIAHVWNAAGMLAASTLVTTSRNAALRSLLSELKLRQAERDTPPKGT